MMANKHRAVFGGKTVFITGAASGIGLGLARALAAAGARLVMTDLDGSACVTAAGAIRAAGYEASAVQLDVRDGPAFTAAVDDAWRTQGRIDMLFNNAGIGAAADARDMTPELWRQVMEVNFMGVINGCQAVWPRMSAHGGGQVVNVASAFGLLPGPLYAAYSATKHGVVGLSRSLRAEGRALGIGVTAVCPGFIETRILDNALLIGVERNAARAAVPFRFIDIDTAIARILRGVARNRGLVVFPWEIRLLWWLDRLAPSLVDRLSAAAAARYRAARNNHD
ncbi:MAG: SDR family NAD(P)-dependent oxidoreductase [Gammaproteobacteria bacterium]